MIDAREFSTTESLEKAMKAESEQQINSILVNCYTSIQLYIKCLNAMLSTLLLGCIDHFTKHELYAFANRTENIAIMLIHSCRELKNIVRFKVDQNEDKSTA